MAVAQIGKDSEALNEENHVRAVLGQIPKSRRVTYVSDNGSPPGR